jgi:hypothetical protein
MNVAATATSWRIDASKYLSAVSTF